MQTKLTLRLEAQLIEDAKTYARKRGKSVSQIVADYFALLAAHAPKGAEPLPPVVRALKGALADYDVGEPDYRKYLEEKYL